MKFCNIIKRKAQEFVTLIYPKFCISCRKIITDNDYFCPECIEDFKQKEYKRCSICDRIIYHNGNCRTCNENKNYYDEGYTVFEYSGNVRNAILNYKYSGYRHAGKILGKLMSDYAFDKLYDNCQYDYITAVPLYYKRFNNRGYNQSDILAKYIANEMNIEYKKLLVRVKQTKPLNKLGLEQRRLEVKNAFDIAKNVDVKNKNILIVDDILTTGATLNECCRVLKKNKAYRVDFFTLSCKSEE